MNPVPNQAEQFYKKNQLKAEVTIAHRPGFEAGYSFTDHFAFSGGIGGYFSDSMPLFYNAQLHYFKTFNLSEFQLLTPSLTFGYARDQHLYPLRHMEISALSDPVSLGSSVSDRWNLGVGIALRMLEEGDVKMGLPLTQQFVYCTFYDRLQAYAEGGDILGPPSRRLDVQRSQKSSEQLTLNQTTLQGQLYTGRFQFRMAFTILSKNNLLSPRKGLDTDLQPTLANAQLRFGIAYYLLPN